MNNCKHSVRVRNFIILTIVCICLFVFTSFLLIDENHFKSNSYISTFWQIVNNTEKKSRTILIWTPFLTDTYGSSFENKLKTCNSKCISTVNKSHVIDADAVVFQLYDLFPRSVNWDIGTRTTVQFPTYRRPDQVWALLNQEPPCNMYWDSQVLNGIFNWTVWYRTDATLWFPYGFGKTLKSSEQITTFRKLKNRNFHAEKTKDVTGMISNCKDQAQRYKLVYKMQKYLNIEMYGGCYDNPCKRAVGIGNKTCDDILSQYKFYLAFENSQCTDYVTEKYWNTLKRNQIPIVNWKNISEKVVIPNSYINVFDFKSIKSLTDYIKEVSSNETLYNTYFHWKMIYKQEVPDEVCSLCDALHQNFTRQVYADLDGWVQKDICPKVGVVNHNMNLISWWLFSVLGIDI